MRVYGGLPRAAGGCEGAGVRMIARGGRQNMLRAVSRLAALRGWLAWRTSGLGPESRARLCVMRCRRRPNDVRIHCKAAKHSDGDRGAVLAHFEAELREPRRRTSVDYSSAAIAARANKRRFVNLLQQLGGGSRSASKLLL